MIDKMLIEGQGAFGVMDESGYVDPKSIREHASTCEIYADLHDWFFKGNFTIVPIKIVVMTASADVDTAQ